MSKSARHIVIVGGGTAGWLAALILGDPSARAKAAPAPRITVVESSKIPTIRVGEGTTAVFRQMLQHFGLDEGDFLRATGATIKYGIRHKDWRRVGHSYDGPIDDPARLAPGIDTYAVAAGKPVAQAHLFRDLIRKCRAPAARVKGRDVPAGPFHHAFHFDQARAGAWLRAQAKGVEIVDAVVQDLERDSATGHITALKLDTGARLTGDLFLDCTGFRRALIGPMGAAWRTYADVLPVNRAMPFWIDLQEDEEITPVTFAWAQKAGWMWQIPTQERLGCGYVYSDAHISPDQAQAEIEAALGHAIEPRNDIRIDAGRLEQPWIGNCIALGLASSFLEPLEATSIHGTIVQVMLLARWLEDPKGAAQCNATVARQVDDFRDFIRLHYVSERRDSAFWQDVATSHPERILQRVQRWQARLPERRDFTPFPGDLPHVQEQLYTPVLDGLGLLDRGAAKAALARTPQRRAQLRKAHDTLTRDHARAASRCLPHRAWLRALHTEQAL
ncbi:tryptophan halogenase family protein [Pseudoruegeria sp. SHC-113]|uniref:tryptophan halogenase family protein n=1 Tax=Pseudoruegeria sp. SHC-113 TaxID=2855439 RepID=UPI0021BAD39A|nr:tryptophan halogenase family protein [Pseudoruegeria sp. SHC-113]MCT8158691.1 tryptophan 7-halogenase [Pseudoruegeria sp. SHC-113]